MTTETRPCRECGEVPDEYAYGGTRGYICKPCYIRKGSENTRKRTEARKVLCPRCEERKFDPQRGTMCFICAPTAYITVKERAAPTLHKHSGYWLVKVPPDDPMVEMANAQRYVRQHRLVMADHIGRPLSKDEQVHHVNHDRGDNRIENLQLMTRADHDRLHQTERTIEVDLPELKRLRLQGLSAAAIADSMGLTYGVVYRRLKDLGLNGYPSWGSVQSNP